MPKRIVDGEGLWRSDKLRTVPLCIRAEYANLIPLALSNGVFEYEPKRIWSIAYSYNRPDISPEITQDILEALADEGLLFRFKAGGKAWGYWVGVDKPGRLPGVSRQGTNESKGPDVPRDELSAYLQQCLEAKGRPTGLCYFIRGEITGRVKIGHSRFPFERMELLQAGSPDKLSLFGVTIGGAQVEEYFHKRYAQVRMHGEWFEGTDDLIEEIRVTCWPAMDSVADSIGIQKLLGIGIGFGSGIGEGSGTGNGNSTPPPDLLTKTTESEEIMQSLKNEIEVICLRTLYQAPERWKDVWDDLRNLCAAFSRDKVVNAFESWAKYRASCGEANCIRPMQEFLKAAPAILRGELVVQMNPETDQVNAQIYALSGLTFTRPELNKLLVDFTKDEIITAYSEFISEFDDFQLRRSHRRFLEGGCAAVRLAQRKRAEEQKASEELGARLLAENQAKASAELEAMRKEEEAVIPMHIPTLEEIV